MKTIYLPSPIVFGRNLKEARKDKGWTQVDLEMASEVSDAMISLHEGGVHPTIRKDTLSKLCKALGVTPEFLMGNQKLSPLPAFNGPAGMGEKLLRLFMNIQGYFEKHPDDERTFQHMCRLVNKAISA